MGRLSDPYGILAKNISYAYIMNKTIYCFWTGTNEMSDVRENSLEYLTHFTGCEVRCIYHTDIAAYILEEHPLHPAYEYLSETHKADYLRTYVMNFHGGGYSDIKIPSGSWVQAFEELEASDAWINGYPELEGGAAFGAWQDLIGICAYICKPHTPLTEEWYSTMIALLDTKLEQLKQHPSRHPQDSAEESDYPIGWNEMLGRIFHRVAYKYKEKVLRSVPMPVCGGFYR